MKSYGVTVPITGHAYIEVVADSEEEAISEAMDKVDNTHLEGWKCCEYITQGNGCYSEWNDIEVEEL